MSQHPDIAYHRQRSEEEDEAYKKQSNIFVDTAALIADRRVIPIYAVLESQSKQLIWAWFWVFATTVICVWTSFFTYAVFISDKPVPHVYDFSPERTIALVNVASHVSVLLTSTLIGAILDALCWALASRPQGATLRTFLTAQADTGLFSVSKLFFTRGTHQKWCILRFLIAAIGWGVGLLLLIHIKTENVYTIDGTFPVIAGIAEFHESVLALEKAEVLGSTSGTPTLQESSINMLILGMSKNFLTDPTFVVDVPPVNCKESDCRSVFLPGGLDLVRQLDGSALFTQKSSEESAIIVNDAQGYQLEFTSTNYTFNAKDCNFYGLSVSGLFSCIVYTNNTILSSVSICPFDIMVKAGCQSDMSWTNKPDASVAMSLYQRKATVAYAKSNFSILSIESMTDPTPAANEHLVADYEKMFRLMYPPVKDILSDVEGVFADFNSIKPDLAYWASVYCVQAEVASAQWLYNSGIPTTITNEQDILEGFLAIPVQFGTLLWHFFVTESLPQSLHTTASSARASYRVRSELWTVLVFAGLTLGLILWAIICLLYVHFKSYGKVEPEHSSAINAAFRRGNPFDVHSKGFWETLGGYLRWIWGKPSWQTTAVAKATDDVVARTVSKKMLIAVDRPEH